MILPIQHTVRRHMTDAVGRLYDIPATDPVLAAIPVEVPPRRALGDLSVPLAFELARRLRKAPRAIAQEIVGALGPIEGFTRIEAAPNGYVNFFLDRPAQLVRWLAADRPLPASFSPDTPAGKTHRRAHGHQPEQGGAHRAPAQRRARRRVRPAAAVPRTRGRDPELHRRYRRAGGRRRGRLSRAGAQRRSTRSARSPAARASTTTAGISTPA